MDYPKHIRRLMREYGAKAYEKELSLALRKVEKDFEKWNAGEIDAFELEERIHKFHNGEARDLYKFYGMGDLSITLAGAIRRGTLDKSEMPEELVEALGLGSIHPETDRDREGESDGGEDEPAPPSPGQ